MVLVGNKCDIEARDVSTQDGENLAKQFGCDFIESSAKENINITEIFNKVVMRVKAANAATSGKKGGKGGSSGKKGCGSA